MEKGTIYYLFVAVNGAIYGKSKWIKVRFDIYIFLILKKQNMGKAGGERSNFIFLKILIKQDMGKAGGERYDLTFLS